jgi:hypothetical protein
MHVSSYTYYIRVLIHKLHTDGHLVKVRRFFLICVLILLYMCPYTAMYVSLYYYTRVCIHKLHTRRHLG